ncbi:MAG: HAD family hydrolase [Deltaproteobacteria bacterium]|nr:HAD family hydrolase [Deltaproteobacteria bacterium]
MSSTSIDAVLLDMGGVLIPEVPSYDAAARDAILLRRLNAAGIDDPEQLVVESGRRLRQAYRDLDAEAVQPNLDEVLAELSASVRRDLLDAFRREVAQPPYANVPELVAELSRRYKLGLVSNTVIPGDHHARSLESAGILQYLEAAAWSANFGKRKPDPAIVLYVLSELGIAPERAVLVGDKIRTDILGASRSGVRSIWLCKPGTPHTGEAEPDFIIQDLSELPALLLRISPGSGP